MNTVLKVPTTKINPKLSFRFSLKVTLTCLILAGIFLRLAAWQSDRHIEKFELIKQIDQRFAAEAQNLDSISEKIKLDPQAFTHVRVNVKGSFDFENEMILRNRNYKDIPGANVLTPLKLADSQQYVIVNRGFLALNDSKPEVRKKFQVNQDVEFIGLVKQPVSKNFFLAPSDPDVDPSKIGQKEFWVDAWLRVDLEKMARQLPYPILPIYLEIISDDASRAAKGSDNLVRTKDGRDDIFMLGQKKDAIKTGKNNLVYSEPIPVFDKTVTAGRHLGYVIEWSFLALLTLAIGFLIQIKQKL